MATFNKILLAIVFITLSYLFIKRLTSPKEEHFNKRSYIVEKGGKNIPKVRNFFGSIGSTKLEDLDQFFTYLDQPLYPCVRHIILGGTLLYSQFLNGDKWMCLDGDLFADPCYVLSFGINHDFSFDDAIAGIGCEVFAFDPTMSKEDHEHSNGVHFFNLGLSNTTETITIVNVSSKVDRYENILKKLHLNNKEITYLKMDIEDYELNFMDDVFRNNPLVLKNVNQLAMEIHPMTSEMGKPPTKKFQAYWKYFQKLENLGFRLAYVDINKNPKSRYMWNGKERSWWYELVWINQS